MSIDAFICAAKKAVADFLAQYHHKPIDVADVAVVWQCKTLQNYKAILIGLTQDEFLFEATYNGDKDELYLDAYDKIKNVCIGGAWT